MSLSTVERKYSSVNKAERNRSLARASRRYTTNEDMLSEGRWANADIDFFVKDYKEYQAKEYKKYLEKALEVLNERFFEEMGGHLTSTAEELYEEMRFWEQVPDFIWPQIYVTHYGDVAFFWKANSANLSFTRVVDEDKEYVEYIFKSWDDNILENSSPISAEDFIKKHLPVRYSSIVKTINNGTQGQWKQILKERYSID